MKKKYTWIAVISAIIAIASAIAAIAVYLKMKDKKCKAQAAATDTDFDDYDIDFLLDSDDEADAVPELDLEDIAEFADDPEEETPAEETTEE